MRRLPTLLAFLLLPAVVACSSGGTGTSGEGTTSTDATSASSAGPKEDMGTVLATVGDQKVYSKEFEQAAARKTPADGQQLSMDEKKDVLQKLVEEKALYQEAKKKGVDEDPKVQKVMINTLLRQEVYAQVKNSDFSQDELKAYFDQHRDEFVVPEKVQIKRIFLKVDDSRPDAQAKKMADDVYKQVKANPAKFGDVATEKSEDPYRRRGGDLGFVGKDGKPGIDQGVVDKAFTMEVGQVSEPFLAGGGYNIVMVANKRERVERTFEQMRGSVLRKVKNEKYKEMYDKYVADVVKNYKVDVDEDALSKVQVDARHGAPGLPPGVGGPEGDDEMGGGGDEPEMDGPGGEMVPPPGMGPGGMPVPPVAPHPGAPTPGGAAPQPGAPK